VLRAQVLVLQALRFGERRIEDELHARREAHVGAIRLRHRLQQIAPLGGDARRIEVELAQHRGDDAARLFDEGDEQMLRRDFGVIELAGEALGREHRFLGLFSELVEIHDDSSRCSHAL
jgi:hypothetical protein